MSASIPVVKMFQQTVYSFKAFYNAIRSELAAGVFVCSAQAFFKIERIRAIQEQPVQGGTQKFVPEVIKKRTVIEEGLEAQIVSMYAKGMTVRDIVSHVQALYGIELSPATVSNITDKIMDKAREWYSRTLDIFYPVVFLDAVHYKVRIPGGI